MEMQRVSTGSPALDSLLRGGFEKDIITTIYGPSGSGKTNICIVSAVAAVKEGKKVIYFDSEGGFSVERMKQLTPEYASLINNIIFLKPTNFDEQRAFFKRLPSLVDDSIGLIVIDTISMLYRLELGKSEDIYAINRELGQQLSSLTEIARTRNIPILIANQVYANFEEKDRVNMVGGDLLKYSSKCIIELQRGRSGIRKAIVKKHRSMAEDVSAFFKIIDEGLIVPENAPTPSVQ